ncbi:MAG TPA: Imm26 family immunity protein [Symbiobacteriaceae bacterium]
MAVKEGDWFMVPLGGGGYGLGVIARLDRRGAALGYFFGPKYEHPPTGADILAKKPADAIFVAKFGTPGLTTGEWPLVTPPGPWRREDWPLPQFYRADSLLKAMFVVTYSDADLITPVSETRVSADAVRGLPKDGGCGQGFVEIRLTRLLADDETSRTQTRTDDLPRGASSIAGVAPRDAEESLEETEAVEMAESDQQAVLVYLDCIGLPDEVYERYDADSLEDQLIDAIDAACVGEFDGIERGQDEFILFMYGPDAEALFRAVEPVLRTYPLCRNARVVIRPGGPEVVGRELRLDAD